MIRSLSVPFNIKVARLPVEYYKDAGKLARCSLADFHDIVFDLIVICTLVKETPRTLKPVIRSLHFSSESLCPRPETVGLSRSESIVRVELLSFFIEPFLSVRE